jgi:hypothetical protein
MATARPCWTLRSPIGATESLIGGTPYIPDPESGEVTTYNPADMMVLKQHGYVLVTEGVSAPDRVLGPIDVENFGRVELANALAERSVTYGGADTRATLADLARTWNTERFPNGVDPSTAPAGATLSQPRPKHTPIVLPEPEDEPMGEVLTQDEVMGMGFRDIVSWLQVQGTAAAGGSKRQLAEAVAVTFEAVETKGRIIQPYAKIVDEA